MLHGNECLRRPIDCAPIGAATYCCGVHDSKNPDQYSTPVPRVYQSVTQQDKLR
jgi:hypothetical protein